MSKNITDLEPKLLWENFYSLTQIPRPSKKEQKAAQWVYDFGVALGLETLMDECGNVLIRKPATAGMANRKKVILQGHVDMVPQKNSGIAHDFEKDPIDAYIEDGWVTARDTTLGADNGIGVAASLAVLKADNLKHGPIEVLVTIDEETGMTGAFGLKPGWLKGDILLNLDSEDEGELYVGCAGGVDVNGYLENIQVETPAGDSAFELSITGLKGGHSGLDIARGRANANKLLFRFLKIAVTELELRLASVKGGSLRNAIPREAFAVITIPSGAEEDLKEAVAKFEAIYRAEFGTVEPNLSFNCSAVKNPQTVMDAMVQDDLIHAVEGCFNGTFRMSQDMPGTVETSSNLAIVSSDKDEITISNLTRSSVDTMKEALVSSLESVLTLAGARVEVNGDYPGWKPNPSSEILTVMKDLYHKHWGVVPEIKAIHAGLECGIIGATYPELDMISFGPTIRFPHSPDEKVNIVSVNEFWKWLVLTLENI